MMRRIGSCLQVFYFLLSLKITFSAPVSYDQFLDTMYNNLKSAKREYRNHEEASKEGEHPDNMDDLAPEEEDDLPG